MIPYAAPNPPLAGGFTLDIVVMSRHLLVAQAVGAALQRRELAARVIPWEDDSNLEHDVDSADVVLVLDELDSRDAVEAVREVAADLTPPIVVLTSRPAGRAWGGVLAAGVAAVLPNETSLDSVEEALDHLRAGDEIMPRGRHDELVHGWDDLLAEEHTIEDRLATLSPRESSVLGMLAEGERVQGIAVRLGVSESTVRSQVKSMRRKLAVDSQLAAVAVARKYALHLVDDPPAVPGPRRGRG